MPGETTILAPAIQPTASTHREPASLRQPIDNPRHNPLSSQPSTMNFCNQCGAKVELRIPPGDLFPRHVCDACGTIHYMNPRLIVGCVPEYEGRILLCRRAIEPRHGFWTVPAGFMENGETLQQAAARECKEEALAEVEIGSLLTIVHVLHAQQVHVFFRATLRTPEYGAGTESLEAELFRAEDIPWSEMAFPSTDYTLRRYLEDRAAGVEHHHFTEADRRMGRT